MIMATVEEMSSPSTSNSSSNLFHGIDQLLPFSPFNTLLQDLDDGTETQTPLSVEDLVRVAASKFVDFHSLVNPSSGRHDDASFRVPELALSADQSASVEMTQLLLHAAEFIGARQYEGARSTLQQCDRVSSPVGNPVQRLVFYYSRALRDRIDRETGRMASRQVATEQSFDLYKVMMNPGLEALEFHAKLPFTQITQMAGIQSIVEHVDGAKRIHVIDLAIRNGQQWTILMHALASRKRRRVEHLKITAVATIGKQLVEQTGERLVQFAQTMNLACSFEAVMVPDFAELSRDHFTVEANELVVVFAEHVMSTLNQPAERLDSLVRAVQSVNPWVMVVTEVEANQNSPVFVNRFVESLFLDAAYLDCLETCMGGDDERLRKFAESTLLGEGSKIVVAIEGRERIIRNMKVDVWRAYFRRFGIVEVELSSSSLYQAELVAKRTASWMPCRVKMEGKSLIVEWKGTPIKSLTAWKFMGKAKRSLKGGNN